MDFDVACMPEYMWKTVSQTIGVRVHGRGAIEEEGNAENFDFCVEDINKKIKNSLSWAPTKMTWVLVEHLTYTSPFQKKFPSGQKGNQHDRATMHPDCVPVCIDFGA